MTGLPPIEFDWATNLAMVNAVLALLIVIFQFKLVRKMKTARWIRYMLILVGVYWFGLYAFVAIVPEGFIEPVMFGQVFVRPAFTVTLAIMTASGLYRLKSP